MTDTRGSRIATALIASLVFGVTALSAQRAPQPGEALFGADRAPDASRRSVDLTVFLSGVHDDDLRADQGSASATREMVRGSYSDLSTLLSVRLPHERLTFDSHVYSSVRRYPQLNTTGSSFSAGTNLAITLGRRTFLRTRADANSVSNFAFETFNRQTRFNENRLPSTGPGDDARHQNMVFDWTSQSYGAAAELTRTLGRRRSFMLMTEARRTESPVLEARTNESLVVAGVRANTAKGSSVHVEYGFRQGVQQQMGSHAPFMTHEVVGRVEQHWQHSRLRRTAISLAGGPSYLQQRTSDTPNDAAIPPVVLADARMFRLVGVVTVDHDFSNRWNVQMSVRRGAGLGQAGLFSNTAALEVRGLLGPRVRVDLRAGYTDGDIGLGAVHDRDDTSFAATQLQIALSRSIAVYGQSFFYHYRFALAGGRLNRSGLRVGMSFWAPLWRPVTA